MSSPRTWGCFHLRDVVDKRVGVFPTHVGVFPLHEIALDKAKSLPHARGGVSVQRQPGPCLKRSSPRTWGCFRVPARRGVAHHVFPTHVGVFHKRRTLRNAKKMSSPRTWGCFSIEAHKQDGTYSLPHARGGVSHRLSYSPRHGRVFPTHVGVFLGSAPRGLLLFCLPHARGGVSRSGRACPVLALSSPRT